MSFVPSVACFILLPVAYLQIMEDDPGSPLPRCRTRLDCLTPWLLSRVPLTSPITSCRIAHLKRHTNKQSKKTHGSFTDELRRWYIQLGTVLRQSNRIAGKIVPGSLAGKYES
ncbi:uncharacterized protein BO95DRAFT_112422 [Aspergillus brunneoviolaceus CBS 621.78]|uniref:Uncharacterized protein n=1 Tax=Aspergillus brunneoviolaceus CBS 621.78 TaxID=1450534 RepID=A0ACD1GNB4_9EURO|nr:hypothetical protein BO95DRAFT_112422 [Aspergillus brunneoviolaceus CBS 621.78]RAH50751.1 hypothetical protein BO95DRAFT_112422 [Aspergillus brunneoviolaceus CBS 621.78]